MIGGAEHPVGKDDVKRVIAAVFEYAAKEAVRKQFQADIENPPPERPVWMEPGHFRKLRDDTLAHVAAMIWRLVPDDYRLTVHDLFMFRCGMGSFVLSEAAHTPMG